MGREAADHGRFAHDLIARSNQRDGRRNGATWVRSDRAVLPLRLRAVVFVSRQLGPHPPRFKLAALGAASKGGSWVWRPATAVAAGHRRRAVPPRCVLVPLNVAAVEVQARVVVGGRCRYTPVWLRFVAFVSSRRVPSVVLGRRLRPEAMATAGGIAAKHRDPGSLVLAVAGGDVAGRRGESKRRATCAGRGSVEGYRAASDPCVPQTVLSDAACRTSSASWSCGLWPRTAHHRAPVNRGPAITVAARRRNEGRCCSIVTIAEGCPRVAHGAASGRAPRCHKQGPVPRSGGVRDRPAGVLGLRRGPCCRSPTRLTGIAAECIAALPTCDRCRIGRAAARPFRGRDRR